MSPQSAAWVLCQRSSHLLHMEPFCAPDHTAYPAAHLSTQNDIALPPPSSDRDLNHTKTPAPRARQRPAMPSSNSQAIAIAVPSIIVKPLCTPLLPKRRAADE
ncbi:hypothetical protein CF336_g307 [Tilletia laevis]|uniref:Uncharacterized protein n=1 Tax=Tilletia caries TaxID=13290 RepID=A0A177U664_9BASI|nr:hypothetical protein CF336_g307 [Tilletia laevis]KAE8265293.1 hypothetical protein A4X03_0g348 [Tilletia caries]